MAMTYLTKLKPEPMGAYSLSTAYGVNSLVMSEDGAAAYISVKDVPAGTPLTNTEYWKIHTDLSAVKQSAEAAAQKANAARGEMLEIARNLTDAVEKSGNSVQAELVGGLPFDRVATSLEPIQAGSGDPSPTNIRAISGWTGAELTRCGKNLMDLSQGYGYAAWRSLVVTTGTPIIFSVYSTAGSGQFNAEIRYEDGTMTAFVLIAPNADNNVWHTYSITPEKQVKYYCMYDVNDSSIRTITKGIIVLGTTSDYEPYTGNTYAADFGQTVYGGTLNWQTGVLTVDMGYKALDGTENWGMEEDGKFYVSADTIIKDVDYTDSIISNMFTTLNHNFEITGLVGITGYYDQNNAFPNRNWIYIRDGIHATVDEFKAWLAAQYAAGTPVQIVYKLATPTTIQLTPQEIKQLQGVNTLYGDGSISMTGRADKALALEARIAALEAAG